MSTPDANAFSLHLSSSDAANGSPAEFTTDLAAPRTLMGRWSLALKEITYTQWNKTLCEKEPMEFVIFARANDVQAWYTFINGLQDSGRSRSVHMFNSSRIPNVPYAIVVRMYRDPKDHSKGMLETPAGQHVNVDTYIEAVNKVMEEATEVFDKLPYFYTKNNGGAYPDVYCCWEYGYALHRKVGIMPIMGPKTRHLLGFEGYDHLVPLLALAFGSDNVYPDLKIGEPGFTQVDDNMMVLCDLVSTTGARDGINGQILRIIPNKRAPEGSTVHYDFIDDYFEVTPKSAFFTVTMKLVSSRTYRPVHLEHPTSFTLQFKTRL